MTEFTLFFPFYSSSRHLELVCWNECLFLNEFIYFGFGSAGSLLPRGLFSSRGERGLLLDAVQGLLIVVASVVVECGL